MVAIKHKFTSAKADGPDNSLVQPSNWNEEHDLTVSAQWQVLGRIAAGEGPAQEIPFAPAMYNFWQLSGAAAIREYLGYRSSGVGAADYTITGGGLATGGGNLLGNRVITVTEATQAEAEAGTSTTTVLTPRRGKNQIDKFYKELKKTTRIYRNSATWTKPADLAYVEVTVIGGGGGGGGAVLPAGGTGGTSSFGAFCSATGGEGGLYGSTGYGWVSNAGQGSGGDINAYGNFGTRFDYQNYTYDKLRLQGGASGGPYSQMGSGGAASITQGKAGAGGGGGCAVKTILAASLGATVAVTVGAGGAGENGGGNGSAGAVIIHEYTRVQPS